MTSSPSTETAAPPPIGPILEVAILDVRPGEADAYEAAFREAQQHLVATPGYVAHELRRRTEAPGRYVLLVWWDSVESHEVGFRGSERYPPWRRLLHPFYEPFPTVEHFEPVEGARGQADGAEREDA